jgi:hypothetical protein
MYFDHNLSFTKEENDKLREIFGKFLSYYEVEALYKKNNYVFFDFGSFNLNIFAIRNLTELNKNDAYDDILGVAYRDRIQEEKVVLGWCTTNPGLHYLLNPMHKDGTAAIVEGQYRGLWTLGWFKNTKALIQRAPVLLYRDRNRDSKFDYNIKDTAWYDSTAGIFMHESFTNEKTTLVGKSSAGCIVPFRKEMMIKITELVELQMKHRKVSTVTFTLFNTNQI